MRLRPARATALAFLGLLFTLRFGGHRAFLDAAAGELIEQAAVADEKAVDLYHFTRLLNGSLDESERLRLIEMMWTIAYADGRASEFDDNLIWRVADLLGVSSTERIALRHRVAAQSGNRV